MENYWLISCCVQAASLKPQININIQPVVMKIPSVIYRHLLSHPRHSFIKVLSQKASYLWCPKVISGKSRNPQHDLTLAKTTGMTYSSHCPWRWLSETALWHHNGFLMTHSLEISSKTPHLELFSQRTGVGRKRYVFIITYLSLCEHHLHLFNTSEQLWRSQSAGKASLQHFFFSASGMSSAETYQAHLHWARSYFPKVFIITWSLIGTKTVNARYLTTIPSAGDCNCR